MPRLAVRADTTRAPATHKQTIVKSVEKKHARGLTHEPARTIAKTGRDNSCGIHVQGGVVGVERTRDHSTLTHGDGSVMSCAARAVELGGSCGALHGQPARTGSCGRTPAAGAQWGRTALQALCAMSHIEETPPDHTGTSHKNARRVLLRVTSCTATGTCMFSYGRPFRSH